ncbi:MAG: cation-transporting P-type ATPase [Chloroflexales bacterium]|nr:cation-transporting P-type ATPase [Chloroflexales bacterium]
MLEQHTSPATPALYACPPAEVYALLGTCPDGLSAAEAAARLSRYGPNRLEEQRRRPLLLDLLANFTHLMALLLWAGGVIGFLAGMPQLGIAIWCVNLINGSFSFWQEYKAERATAALRRLLPSAAHVVRDGVEQLVPSEELVPGDVLLLSEGDHISADTRLTEASALRVDQSTLTGESRPVTRTCAPVASAGLDKAELRNIVYAGTAVIAGVGRGVVFATGMRSAFGLIAHLTQSVAETPSPLQQELARTTRVVTGLALGVGAIFFALAALATDVGLAASFMFAMGMIVAFVPEGLLPTVTLALAMGVQRMARRNALVKRLSAVETLGCATVICTDKTGTLTENEMTVRRLWVAGRQIEVSGEGYTTEGALSEGGAALGAPPNGDLGQLLLAGALCTDVHIVPATPRNGGAGVLPHPTIIGDPTEAALQIVALKGGLSLKDATEQAPRLREIPFDSRRKRMSTVHRRITEPGAPLVAYMKGAPSEVLARCTSLLVAGEARPLDAATRDAISAANDAYARDALRVLAVAMRPLAEGEQDAEVDVVERELTFVGLEAMLDPPRPEVPAAVERCQRASIRVVMITGDYGLTAASIARRVGIAGPGVRVVSGGELDGMRDEELDQIVQGEVLFARATPEHKLRVVSALQRLGQIVAVTGDGVNDAPALKKADIGVAMGLCGTDVAREAADIVLTDDNFASIVSAVEEGRAVYANIKKFITYIFTSNMSEAVPFIFFVLSQGRIPLALTVMLVLAIDLGTDMVPALALGAEPPEPGMMDRPPRRLSEHMITGDLLAHAFLWLGLTQAAVAMLAFYWKYWTGGYWGQWLDLPASGPLYAAAIAATFAAVVMTQVGNLFAQRSTTASLAQVGLGGNRLLWVGVAVELTLLGLIVYVPWVAAIFGTAPLAPVDWVFLLAWVPALPLVDEVRKALRRRAGRGGPLRSTSVAR